MSNWKHISYWIFPSTSQYLWPKSSIHLIVRSPVHGRSPFWSPADFPSRGIPVHQTSGSRCAWGRNGRGTISLSMAKWCKDYVKSFWRVVFYTRIKTYIYMYRRTWCIIWVAHYFRKSLCNVIWLHCSSFFYHYHAWNGLNYSNLSIVTFQPPTARLRISEWTGWCHQIWWATLPKTTVEA